MIPVHIWTHANAIDLSSFPEYFYDIRDGRRSLFEKPILHKRFTRLNYNHAGEFAKIMLNETGKPALHIFVLTPRDWLQGPYNTVMPDVCQAIVNVAWTNHRTITLFVNVSGLRAIEAPPETYAAYNFSLDCNCRKRPHQAALIIPRNTPNIHSADTHQRGEKFADPALMPFFKELRDIIRLDIRLINTVSPIIRYKPTTIPILVNLDKKGDRIHKK
jgi:hypothetical protein